MTEFKPTPNRMICNKNKECKADCIDKESHPFMHYCLMACGRKGGIAGAVCEPIPLTGAQLIADERRRQIEVEGWDEKHDSETHSDGGLALVSACYTVDVVSRIGKDYLVYPVLNRLIQNFVSNAWPWDLKWWKPTPNDPIRQLVKAGALIAAEIDRLQRMKDNEKI